MSPSFAVVAKAGGSGEAAENTCEAFAAARAAAVPDGARLAFEVDVRKTADGALVAFHDATLERTTNGAGRMAAMTLATVRALDAGPNGERVPTLEEVCEATEGHELIWELHDEDPHTARAVLRVLGHLSPTTRDRVVVASEHDRVIHALRAVVPALRTAATASEAKRTLVLERCRLGRWAPRGRPLFVPEWYRGIRVLSPRFVRGARSAGDNVWVWVVDDAKRARALIELGVDGCFTTRPQGLCRELSLLASAGTDGNRVEL